MSDRYPDPDYIIAEWEFEQEIERNDPEIMPVPEPDDESDPAYDQTEEWTYVRDGRL